MAEDDRISSANSDSPDINPYEALKFVYNNPEEADSRTRSIHDSEPVSDPYQLLNIVYNSEDDSLTRLFPVPASTSDDQNTKDIPLKSETKTWVRLFKPSQSQQGDKPTKLPLIIYFHGGGFVIGSAASTIFHDFCAFMATQLPAFVVSVDYRLAPEYRLPAAYDDAVDALNWVKDQALGGGGGGGGDQSWLRLTDEYVDFSKCFLMGSSAGGNIAYNAGVRSLGLDLDPMKIKGLILNQPYIGGAKRTESEIRRKNDRILPLVASDLMWDLSLPRGSNRDHVFCNPMVENDETSSGVVHGFVGGGIKCFVDGYKYDPLIDRQREFVKMLERKGVKVVGKMDEDGFHGTELFVHEKAESLMGVLRTFVYDD